MTRFLHEHSLSIALLIFAAILIGWSGLLDEGWGRDTVGGMGHDAFGAFLLVVLGKYLLERGKHPSPESK